MFSGNDPYLIISGTSNYDRCDVTQNQEKDNLSIHSAKSVLAKGYINDHWVSARITSDFPLKTAKNLLNISSQLSVVTGLSMPHINGLETVFSLL